MSKTENNQSNISFFIYLQKQSTGNKQRYAQINISVPILAQFFAGDDPKPALRLNRASVQLLLLMLPIQKAHGWTQEIEVLVTLYWLACGASYRVTADIFGMPLSTVCRVVHKVVDALMGVIHNVISLPKRHEVEGVGIGFSRLAGHEAFKGAVGAIDGCHIRIVPHWQCGLRA